MAESFAVSIAADVEARLNGIVFSLPFLARRAYRPEYNLTTDSGVKVFIVPKSFADAVGSRADDQCDYEIDIGVMYKLTGDDDKECDSVMKLVEEIADELRERSTLPDTGARLVAIANDPIFAPDQLTEKRVFTSVITATYRTFR